MPNILGNLGLHFFSVCDGHGVNGHHVSQFIKEEMPRRLEQIFKNDHDYMKPSKLEKFYSKMPQYLHNVFMETDA